MLRDFTKSYKFELYMGGRCNFKCRYCFEPDSPWSRVNTDITLDQVLRYTDFIKYVIKSIGDDTLSYNVSSLGGETLLYVDLLLPLARALKDDIEDLAIVTNGALVHKKIQELLTLKRLLPSVTVITSYDFNHQDMTRQPGTYKLIRDHIRLLNGRGFSPVCITVFEGDTLPLAWDRFQDFLKLKEELPNLVVKFNLSRNAGAFDDMDEDAARRSLEKIRDYIGDDEQLASSFLYNPAFMYRQNRLEHAFFGSTLLGMSMHGDIFPGYDVPFISDFAKETLRLGSVFDDFEELEDKRRRLMKSLPIDPPAKCITCNAVCRVLPWARMVDNINQYNIAPDEKHCYIHRLVSEYLPFKRAYKGAESEI